MEKVKKTKLKTFRLNTDLLVRAKKALSAKTDTETVETALKWIVEECEINNAMKKFGGALPGFGR